MKARARRIVLAAAALAILALAGRPKTVLAEPISRAYVIVMENQGFDRVTSSATPYIASLAARYGLATRYYGVTHPSLPNYLALIGGDYFGVQDDRPSCYAAPRNMRGCHGIDAPNLIDLLEQKRIAWAAYEQAMPSDGYLGAVYPLSGPALYAQKHNPFVYFRDVALDARRMAHVKALPTIVRLQADLANPKTAPRFVFIVPDQCHDMHGSVACWGDALLRTGDAYAQQLVEAILQSPSFDPRSVIFVTWDEDDFSSDLGCCDSPKVGGGRVATIAIFKPGRGNRRSAIPYNHYSLLATIEEGFGLPKIANTKDTQRVRALREILARVQTR